MKILILALSLQSILYTIFQLNIYNMQHKQALILDDIDSVVNRFQAVTPDSPFYVNFEDLRGNFQEKEVLRALNVKVSKGVYAFTNAKNYDNKTLLFLAGMRGSGKTSELSRYAKNLNKPECFFVITCNIDQGLDMDKVEYMDILIFSIRKTFRTCRRSKTFY